jgi:hypothetical protein
MVETLTGEVTMLRVALAIALRHMPQEVRDEALEQMRRVATGGPLQGAAEAMAISTINNFEQAIDVSKPLARG